MARNLKVTLLADRPELHKFDLVLARICEKRWLEQSNLLTGYIIVDYLSPVNEHNQSEKSGQWSGGPQGGQPRPPCMAAAAALCPLGSRGRPRRQRALIKQRRVDWRHRRCSWQRTAGPTRIGRLPGGFPGTLIDVYKRQPPARARRRRPAPAATAAESHRRRPGPGCRSAGTPAGRSWSWPGRRC